MLKRAATKKSRNDLIHAEEGEDRFADLCAVGESLWVLLAERGLSCDWVWKVHLTSCLSPLGRCSFPSFPTAHPPVSILMAGSKVPSALCCVLSFLSQSQAVGVGCVSSSWKSRVAQGLPLLCMP